MDCRSLALEALGQYATEDVNEKDDALIAGAIASRLADEDRRVRFGAMQGLSLRDHSRLGAERDRVMAQLEELRQSADEEEKQVAFATLVDLARTTEAGLALVVRGIRLGGVDRRTSLAAVGGDDELLDRILQDPFEGVLIEVLRWLNSRRRGAKPTRLLPLLTHKSAKIRTGATRALIDTEGRGRPPPSASLRVNLRSESKDLRKATVILIGHYGAEARELAPDLAARLLQRGSSIGTSAALALERMGPEAEAVVPQLALALESTQGLVLRPVLRTLTTIATETDSDLSFLGPRVRLVAEHGPRMARKLARDLLDLLDER